MLRGTLERHIRHVPSNGGGIQRLEELGIRISVDKGCTGTRYQTIEDEARLVGDGLSPRLRPLNFLDFIGHSELIEGVRQVDRFAVVEVVGIVRDNLKHCDLLRNPFACCGRASPLYGHKL